MNLEYTIRTNPRARRINITVRRDGSVFVMKPRWVSVREVERLVARSTSWIARTRARFAHLPKTTRIESSKREYKRYKKAVLNYILHRLRHFNVHYHLAYKKVFVRNQKSRWGSCSHAGNLSFNYRILFLPPDVADYVIVHELCHRKEMNHGKRFWALVARVVPEYKVYRKELLKWGRALLAH